MPEKPDGDSRRRIRQSIAEAMARGPARPTNPEAASWYEAYGRLDAFLERLANATERERRAMLKPWRTKKRSGRPLKYTEADRQRFLGQFETLKRRKESETGRRWTDADVMRWAVENSSSERRSATSLKRQMKTVHNQLSKARTARASRLPK
ncbi:MAG: hypothetical protein L0177_13855 [Chloroflexi bacterium]|nr:hypothetical protein [Chloroflexota bacterium]